MSKQPNTKRKREIWFSFWKSYLMFGSLSLGFILLVCIYSFFLLEGEIKKNTYKNVEKGMELLGDEMNTLNRVVFELSSDTYFAHIRRTSENLQTSNQYDFIQLRDKMEDTTKFLSFAKTPMLYYPGRLLFFTDVVYSKEIYNSKARLYSENYGRLEDWFEQLSSEKHSYDYLPADLFHDSLEGDYYGIPYVHVYSYATKKENPLFAAILPIDSLVELWKLEDIRDIITFKIYNINTGEILYLQDNDIETKVTSIVVNSENSELAVEVNIPISYYFRQLSGLIILGIGYILCFLIIAIFISIRLALKNAERHASLDHEVSHWMLREYILSGLYGRQLEEFKERYSDYTNPFRLLVIQLSDTEWSILATEMKSLLKNCKIDYWFLSKVKPNCYVMLGLPIEEKAECVKQLTFFQGKVRGELHCECIISVSDLQYSMSELKKLYQKVRLNMRCFPEYKLSFQDDIEILKEDNLKKLNMLENLQLSDMILCGNDKDAVKLIRNQWLEAKAIHKETILRQLYTIQYTILFDVASKLNYEIYELNQIEDDNIHDLEKRMVHAAETLCLLSNEKKKNDKEDSHKQIIEYIKENYSDANLCMTMLVEEFGLSRRTIYKIIKEFTGMNFLEYVEHLRLQKALVLLDETDYGIRHIIEQCGFSAENTFFNVFKRKFGITPSSYRNMKKKEEKS